jgi:tetratricopeptide (TPR) repeat protein
LERAQRRLEKELSEVKSKTAKERMDMHYNLAVVFEKNGMYEDAEREYLKCLKIDPNDADVHYNLGILYDDKLNNNAKAIEHYNSFLKLRPIGKDAQLVRQWILMAEQEKRIGAEMR